MFSNLLKKIMLSVSAIGLLFVGQISAQQTPSNPKTKVNFGYSQNPKTKVKKDNAASENSVNNENAGNNAGEQENDSEKETVAVKTLEIAKRASVSKASPTEIYKVGIGDVLFISLQNAPSKASSYFTVLNDGTIDYPLAGEMIQVAGLTTEEIESLLKEKVKLYENPQVAVKVREHASHVITVLGFVEKAGEKYLQREAMPLYVVRAEAIVQPNANRVIIKRAGAETESFDLNDRKYEDILIFPGDIVEFTNSANNGNNPSAPQFYYIGGNIVSAGQKDFHQGMTLTQAVLASGGLKKSNIKKVIIRRKNSEGLLISTEYNLKDIKDGKIPDPTILAGDTIEIGG